jgi:hypothetical protein
MPSKIIQPEEIADAVVSLVRDDSLFGCALEVRPTGRQIVDPRPAPGARKVVPVLLCCGRAAGEITSPVISRERRLAASRPAVRVLESTTKAGTLILVSF